LADELASACSNMMMATFKIQKMCSFAEPSPFQGVGAFLQNTIDVFLPDGSDGNTFLIQYLEG
jgi:hypothetical protein